MHWLHTDFRENNNWPNTSAMLEHPSTRLWASELYMEGTLTPRAWEQRAAAMQGWNPEILRAVYEHRVLSHRSASTEPWHLQQGCRTVSICLYPSSPLCSARMTKGRFYLWEHVSKKCFLEGGQTVLGMQSQPAGKSDTDIPICSHEAWKDLKNGEK